VEQVVAVETVELVEQRQPGERAVGHRDATAWLSRTTGESVIATSCA
jgi:hypothetical protein